MRFSLRRWVKIMNNKKLHGWQQVFCFSFKEEFKQKTYKAALTILFLIALCSMPLVTLVKNSVSDEPKASEISTITVYDETGLLIDYDNALSGDRYKGVSVNDSPEIGYEEHISKLEKEAESTEIVIRLSYDSEGYYDMTVVKAADSPITYTDINNTAEDFEEYFNKARLQAINVTEEQVEYMTEPVECKVEYISETGELLKEAGPVMSQTEYVIMVALMMIVTLVVSFCGNKVANSIVTEKSTRVIEYLIINVKPLALLVGKVLAAIFLVIIQVIAIAIGIILSFVLNELIWGAEAQSFAQAFPEIMDVLRALNPVTVILSIIIIFVGNLFYCILAGFVGASVSKMEEITEGMKIFQMVAVVGAYLGIALCMAEMSGGTNVLLENVCTFLPIASPFVVPPFLLLGKISVLKSIVSLMVLVIFTVVMFLFTAKVFVATILYQGKVLKIKDVLKLVNDRPVEER